MNTHVKTSDTLYGEQMLHITSLTHIRYILNVLTVQNNMNTIYYALNYIMCTVITLLVANAVDLECSNAKCSAC